MLELLENTRNRAIVRTMKWFLQHTDKRITANVLCREIGISLSCAKRALTKLESVLQVEEIGKMRVYGINIAAMHESIMKDGLRFSDV